MAPPQNRATVLLDIISHIHSVNATISELLQFILVSGELNDPSLPVYHDLLINAKTIPAMLHYHPATADAVQSWAHDTMRAHYKKCVHELSLPEHGWHFVASHARPSQVQDFHIEDMAAEIRTRAPDIWALVQALLGGESEGAEVHASAPAPLPDAMDIDSNLKKSCSDDEYWSDEDDADVEAIAAKGINSGNARGEKGAHAQSVRRRVAPEVITRIRTVVIMCILMNNHDQRCNALQSTLGIFLHASGTPDRVIKVMSRMGVSISLPSIHRAVKSLSEETCADIRDLGQSFLASFAYDNFEFLLPTRIPTVDKPGEGLVHLTSGTLLRLEHGVTLEDLRCSNLVWDRSEFNPKASDPRPFNPYKTMQFLYTLHPEPASTNTPNALTRQGRFRRWVFMRTLFKHGPAGLRSRLNDLRDPEFVEAIPIQKLTHLPLRTMDLNQSKISGNIAAIQDMFEQAGIGDSRREHISKGRLDMEDLMTIFHGDLGTYERVLSARRRRSIEDTPYDRLQSVAFSEGFFHFKMAAADALWRILMTPPQSRMDEMSFAGLVGKLRPRESSHLIANAKFRQQHELIGHVSVVLQLDAWRVEVQRRYPRLKSLEEWAASKPAMGDIIEISEHLVREYVEGEGLDFFDMECRPKTARDQVRENTMRLQNYSLLYDELCYAMNAGDIGRLETLLPPWVRIFRATGKHKYSNHTLRFMHDLYFVYPEGLRNAIRLNILVNPTGKPLEFRAVDWVVELLNLYTKFTYGGEGSNYTKARVILESVLVLVYRSSLANLERNFALSGLSHVHAAKDMRQTFKMVLEFIQGQKANEFEGGRKVEYAIPDVIMQGGEIIESEEPGKGAWMEQTGEVAEAEAEGHLGEEALENELTAEDLSTEGIIF